MKPTHSFLILISILLLTLVATPVISKAQNVAINSTGNTPNASAMIDVQSANKGILIPQVSLTALNAASPLSNPAPSLLIYNTNTAITGGKGYYYNAGTSGAPNWVKLVVVDSTGIVQTVTSTGDIIKLERFPMGEVSMAGNTTATNISGANSWTKAAGTTSSSVQEVINSLMAALITGLSTQVLP